MNLKSVPIHLSYSLKNRRSEFENYLIKALDRIRIFAAENDWQNHIEEPFLTEMRVFARKSDFDKTLLELAGADLSLKLPKTYSGALEKKILILVSPEIYARNYPQGIEDPDYTVLGLTARYGN